MKARDFISFTEGLDDRWRVSIDYSSKSFSVYKGPEEICTGKYNSSSHVIYDLDYSNTKHEKNRKTQSGAISTISKNFAGYTVEW